MRANIAKTNLQQTFILRLMPYACDGGGKGSKAEPEFNVLISIWGLCWCNLMDSVGLGGWVH